MMRNNWTWEHSDEASHLNIDSCAYEVLSAPIFYAGGVAVTTPLDSDVILPLAVAKKLFHAAIVADGYT